jgi:hypothetical protein
VREAIVSKLVGNICKNVVKANSVQFTNLADKRDHDVKVHGNNLSQEREVTERLVDTWKERTGEDAIVTNDNARSDALLGIKGAFLPLQVKTTAKRMDNQNSWLFNNLTGYADMPILCWRCDHNDGWVYDGKDIINLPSGCFVITPGGKNDKLALRSGQTYEEVVDFLIENAGKWNLITEEEGRNDFCSTCHSKEMKGINAYITSFPGKYTFPKGQNTHVDLLDSESRIQFKTASIFRGHLGFYVNMKTSCGKSFNGKQLFSPYRHDSFDVLVVVWFDENEVPHFWRIPSSHLEKRGILSNEFQKGKKSFYVYCPPGLGNRPKIEEGAGKGGKKADRWSLSFYLQK